MQAYNELICLDVHLLNKVSTRNGWPVCTRVWAICRHSASDDCEGRIHSGDVSRSLVCEIVRFIMMV
jgi:hypothetical protein